MKLAKYAFLTGLAVALVFAPGCKRKSGDSHMLSVVQMGDPQAQGQLVSGFYAIEEGAWRWTKQKFSVLLGAPAGAAQKGAWLRVEVTAPDALIAKVGAVTLTARVNGEVLAPETYSAAGTYTYERAVAAGSLEDVPVRVDFTLDKTMQPDPPDRRTLGIVVTSAGLEPK
jgi:hypothetical protein